MGSTELQGVASGLGSLSPWTGRKQGLEKPGALCMPGLSPPRSHGSTVPDDVRQAVEGWDLEVLGAALFFVPVPHTVLECLP